jgi:putative endonuclease
MGNRQINKKGSSSIRVGRIGEKIAEEYLVTNGFEIVDKNFRTPYGEIDLVACKDDLTVFVEVKTRRSLSFGYPEGAITARKLQHMISAAQAYMQSKENSDGTWRIDVIAVQIGNKAEVTKITHFENLLV